MSLYLIPKFFRQPSCTPRPRGTPRCNPVVINIFGATETSDWAGLVGVVGQLGSPRLSGCPRYPPAILPPYPAESPVKRIRYLLYQRFFYTCLTTSSRIGPGILAMATAAKGTIANDNGGASSTPRGSGEEERSAAGVFRLHYCIYFV